MKHKNIVMLEGRIHDDYKYKRTKEGREYATFTLLIRSFDKDFRDNTETKVDVKIRIMVFDHQLVQYLRKVNAHNGCMVSVFGRINSYRAERHGEYFTMNDVVVRDIHIMKTIE